MLRMPGVTQEEIRQQKAILRVFVSEIEVLPTSEGIESCLVTLNLWDAPEPLLRALGDREQFESVPTSHFEQGGAGRGIRTPTGNKSH